MEAVEYKYTPAPERELSPKEREERFANMFAWAYMDPTLGAAPRRTLKGSAARLSYLLPERDYPVMLERAAKFFEITSGTVPEREMLLQAIWARFPFTKPWKL